MVLALIDDDDHQPNSTPKLSLFKLPRKTTKEPPLAAITMLTPPLRPPVSVPFRWEEAPGKPRAGSNAPAKNNVIRSLELPPRLVSMQEEYVGKMNKIPSPTTVLDEPYVGRSMSLACTFSFRKGSTVALIRDEDEGPTKGIGGVVRFGSGRWGSFREDYGGKVRRGSSEISRTTLGDMMRSEDHHNVKITRVKRRRSFFGFSSKNSNKLLGGIYASFKQAVAWRA